MRIIRVLLFLLLSTHVYSASASDTKYRFGHIDMENLQGDICPIDSNAHAYYIFHNGKTDFYTLDNFKLRRKRHYRIKIVDERALDLASVEIPLFGSGDGREKISSIKAITYNADGDDIIESEMHKAAIIYEAAAGGLTMAKFALPNVKAGSIIEVEYTVTSGYIFNLRTWTFQKMIPVLDSNFSVEIPEYFDYMQFPYGYIQIDTEESLIVSKRTFTRYMLHYHVTRFDYSASDIPAFPSSEFLTARKNYISSVEFELRSFSIPGFSYQDFSSSWPKISSKFIDHDNFGVILKNSRCLNDQVDSMASLAPLAKMHNAFEYIKAHTQWNHYNSCYASQAIKKTLEKGSGNAADINLSLVALMRRVGLEAYPVALSTRGHGFVNHFFPKASSLNYVVALCRIDGQSYLMDATDDYASIDLLPSRCLNGSGLLIKDKSDVWVSLQSDNAFTEYFSYVLDLSTDGQLKGSKITKLDSYAAYAERNHLSESDDEESFVYDLEDRCDGLTINDYTLKNVDDLDKKMLMQIDIDISDAVSRVNDLMYLKPLLYERWDSNPLKLEERLYPVEYLYPTSSTCAVQIKIPEGYMLESVPESVNMRSPEGDCMFRYICSEMNGAVSVYSQFKRSKILYPYTDYKDLKAFYEQVVKKHNEQVVFRKI